MGKKRALGPSDLLEDSDGKKRKGLEAVEDPKKVKEEPERLSNGNEVQKAELDLDAKNDEEKEEMKDEIKAETKEECHQEGNGTVADVKEEENEEESRQLDSILGDAAEVRVDRGKKKKQKEEAALEVEPVETETEYEELDLSIFPEQLVVEACSYQKLDGTYRIMRTSSRGRPAYVKVNSSKSTYFYWHPGKRWQIGFEFGTKKCAASIPDLGSLGPPLEPYPRSWKAIEKNSSELKSDKSKEKFLCLAMRVFDERLRDHQRDFQEELFQPVEFAAKSRYENDNPDSQIPPDPEMEGQENKASGSSRPSKPSSPKKPSVRSKPRTKANNRSSPKKPLAPKVPANLADDEEAAMVLNAAQQSDSDEESKATAKATSSQPSDSADSSGTESDEEESSSSESFSDQEAPDADYEALGTKAQSIVDRLKGMTQEQAASKFNELFKMIRQKSKNGNLVPLTGCSYADMKHLAQWSTRHLGVPDLWSSLTAPPPQMPKTPQEPQPHTPPVDEEALKTDVAAQLPHHTMAAPKSVLRKPGQKVERGGRRVQHHDEKMEVVVTSYKTCGEGLWFQCPGSLVNCDNCNRLVPQAMGCLQGAPHRSQFAQNLFMCQDCSSRT